MPGVEVSVKMKHGDRAAMKGVEGAEGWEGDAVIAAESEQDGRVGGRGRRARAELEVCLCHLAKRECVIEGCDGNVTTIEDTRPRTVRIECCSLIEAAEGGLTC